MLKKAMTCHQQTNNILRCCAHGRIFYLYYSLDSMDILENGVHLVLFLDLFLKVLDWKKNGYNTNAHSEIWHLFHITILGAFYVYLLSSFLFRGHLFAFLFLFASSAHRYCFIVSLFYSAIKTFRWEKKSFFLSIAFFFLGKDGWNGFYHPQKGTSTGRSTISCFFQQWDCCTPSRSCFEASSSSYCCCRKKKDPSISSSHEG